MTDEFLSARLCSGHDCHKGVERSKPVWGSPLRCGNGLGVEMARPCGQTATAACRLIWIYLLDVGLKLLCACCPLAGILVKEVCPHVLHPQRAKDFCYTFAIDSFRTSIQPDGRAGMREWEEHSGLMNLHLLTLRGVSGSV